MKVIIIGGGFAGINLALSLAHNIKFQVTLVDKKDHHFFSPFLYQLTAGNLEPDDISFPFLKMFSGKENLKFHSGLLMEVLSSENKIILNNGILEYEYLILATGSVTHFYDHQNIAKKAFGFKTANDALALKNHLTRQFETFSEANKNLKFVIAGGGSGGVEASAMLAEMLVDIQVRQKLNIPKPEIYLIEKSGYLLPSMSLKFQRDSYNYLKELGINILLNRHVQDYSDNVVLLSSGEKIETETLIWTAGIKAGKFEGFISEAYHEDDRLRVDAYNKVVGTYNVFAIGDISIQKETENFPNGYPKMAQVAIQQGQNLAENFQLMAERKALKEFVYKDSGTSILIGGRNAITSFSKPDIYFQGGAGWFIRLFLNLRSLMVEGNRLRLIYLELNGYLKKGKSD